MSMVYFSVTRLRVRSARYLLPFIPHVLSSGRQAQRAAGFLGGKMLYEFPLTFWTATAWMDEAAMRAYRIAGPHRAAMPLLLDWCDEAAVAHWSQTSATLPDWLEAHRRMVAEGRLSKVHHPSSAQAEGRIAAPRPSPFEIRLRPVSKGNVKQSFVLFVQVVLVGIFLTACSGPLAGASSQVILPEPEDLAALQGVAARGQSVYQSTCAACHGPQARGIAGLGKDLADSEFIKDQSDAELLLFLWNGRRASDPLNDTGLEMPPKGGNPALTDQDLADIVAYLRTLSE